MMQFCDFMSAIFDNWYFLQKIEIMDPTGRALTDQRCAMFSVAWIILGVIDKLRQMHREANQAEKIGSSGSQENLMLIQDKRKSQKKFTQLLANEKLWFINKLFDIPVQIYFIWDDYYISRGNGHGLSLMSPLIYFFRLFTGKL